MSLRIPLVLLSILCVATGGITPREAQARTAETVSEGLEHEVPAPGQTSEGLEHEQPTLRQAAEPSDLETGVAPHPIETAESTDGDDAMTPSASAENSSSTTSASADLEPEVTPPPAASSSRLVTGEVLYLGPEPKVLFRLPRSARASCGDEIRDELLLLGPGRSEGAERALRNAVVWVETTAAQVEPATSRRSQIVDIDQRNCRFVPRVQALQTGDAVRFHNGDRTLHTVVLEREGDLLWKRAMPVPGQRLKRRLDEPGRVTAKCEAGHYWAVAHLHVFSHPWFVVTGDDGRFALADLPNGKHTLVVWHEQLGEQRQEFEMNDGAEVSFTFQAPSHIPVPKNDD